MSQYVAAFSHSVMSTEADLSCGMVVVVLYYHHPVLLGVAHVNRGGGMTRVRCRGRQQLPPVVPSSYVTVVTATTDTTHNRYYY